MLRVLIPALQVGPGQTGVGNYTLELVRGMSQLPRREELILVGPHPDRFDFVRGLEGFRVERIGLPREDPWGRMLATHTKVPVLAHRLGADVVLAPNFIVPLGLRCASAVTVHDLTFWRFPKATTGPKRLYYRLLVRRSMRRASRIFVDSLAIGRELEEFAPEVAGKLRLAPLGVRHGYLVNGDREEGQAAFRARRDLLFVGTLEPRKNLERLLIAHGNLCRSDPDFPRLRLVGGKGWEDAAIQRALKDHPAPSRVLLQGYCDDAALKREYDSALAFLFPSLYEGFGLPVLEAMARGCPVLTSRGIATEEVAGAAACLVDPHEVADLENGMRRLVDDPELRQKLSASGLARAAEFSWRRCAQATLEGLHDAVSEGEPSGGTDP